MASDSREEILKFLGDLGAFYGSYHNHKENAAWLGSVLYVGLVAQIAVSSIKPPIPTLQWKVGALLMIAGLFALSIAFITMQLRLRALAQNRLEASFRVRSSIVGTPEVAIDPGEFAAVWDDRLPLAVKREALRLASLDPGPRPVLERMLYALLAFSSLAAAAAICAA